MPVEREGEEREAANERQRDLNVSDAEAVQYSREPQLSESFPIGWKKWRVSVSLAGCGD
jgi:hypothetical protein